MVDNFEGTAEFGLIEAVGAALRRELGPYLEEQPGGVRDESSAGLGNRAFRVVARCILRTVVSPEENTAGLLNRVLDRLARRRMVAGGLNRSEVEHLIVSESGGRDD